MWIYILAIIFQASNLLANHPDCGKSARERVGSQGVSHNFKVNSSILKQPWAVAIVFKEVQILSDKLHCSGSILSEKYVLTAAHCFTGSLDPTKMIIVAGSDDPANPIPDRKANLVQKKEIEDVKIHPLSEVPAARYDLALVKIKGQFKFRNSRWPICIPEKTRSREFHFDRDYSLVGFGRDKNKVNSGSVLTTLDLEVEHTDDCSSKYADILDDEGHARHLLVKNTLPKNFNDDSLICASKFERSSGPCPGDSGGLFMRYERMPSLKDRRAVQTAVIHGAAQECNSEHFPAILVRIDSSEALSWINSIAFSKTTATPQAKVNCVWGKWSNWSSCSKTCGSGISTKSRTKIRPERNGGNCPGSRSDRKPCNTQSCASPTIAATTTTLPSKERKIILVTGRPLEDGTQLEIMDKFNQPKQCPSIQNFPTMLEKAMAGVLKDSLIICGGSTTKRWKDSTNKCHKLEKNGQWSTLQQGLKEVKHDGAAATVVIDGEEYLWITGGRDTNGKPLKTTDLLSSSGIISVGKDLPDKGRNAHCMLVFDKQVLMIGGFTGVGHSNSTLLFDSADGFSHKEGPSMNNRRVYHSCSTMVSPAHQGRTVAVVAGSYYGDPDGDDGRDTAEILDFTVPGSSWELTAKLPEKMWYGSRMSSTPDGTSVILSYENKIHKLKCQVGRQCTWETQTNRLKIKRQYHIQATVSVHNC